MKKSLPLRVAGRVNECNGDITPTIQTYNRAVPKRPNTKAPLKAFEGFGQMRERDGDPNWFPVEFLIYYDDRKLRRFAYVRRKDGREIPDGHYFFLDDLGERTRRWRKLKGEWQMGWRYRQ